MKVPLLLSHWTFVGDARQLLPATELLTLEMDGGAHWFLPWQNVPVKVWSLWRRHETLMNTIFSEPFLLRAHFPFILVREHIPVAWTHTATALALSLLYPRFVTHKWIILTLQMIQIVYPDQFASSYSIFFLDTGRLHFWIALYRLFPSVFRLWSETCSLEAVDSFSLLLLIALLQAFDLFKHFLHSSSL